MLLQHTHRPDPVSPGIKPAALQCGLELRVGNRRHASVEQLDFFFNDIDSNNFMLASKKHTIGQSHVTRTRNRNLHNSLSISIAKHQMTTSIPGTLMPSSWNQKTNS